MTLHFQDLLRILVGKKVGVRLPGSKNTKHTNTAPAFYTAMEKIEVHIGAAERLKRNTKAMGERFVIREWKILLPMASRKPDFPKYAKCFVSLSCSSSFVGHSVLVGKPSLKIKFGLPSLTGQWALGERRLGEAVDKRSQDFACCH